MTNRDPMPGEPDLDDLLRALAQDDAQVRAPERLHARVMAKWDEERHVAARIHRAWWSSRFLPHAAALAAAVILMVVWLAARGNSHAGRISHTVVPLSEATNLMTSPPLEAEVLQLVRVRMPRGALQAFGIALVDPEAAAEVEVDVVVGEDGFPRSIRRVQPIAAGR